MLMCCINGATSLLAGFAIFSILGYMSDIASKPIAEIVKPGTLLLDISTIKTVRVSMFLIFVELNPENEQYPR